MPTTVLKHPTHGNYSQSQSLVVEGTHPYAGWVTHLLNNRYSVTAPAQCLLQHLWPTILPTRAVTLTGFPMNASIQEVLREADQLGFNLPKPDLAGFLMEMLPVSYFKNQGIDSLIVMHEPIAVNDAGPSRLMLSYDGQGISLSTYCHDYDGRLPQRCGYAFIM